MKKLLNRPMYCFFQGFLCCYLLFGFVYMAFAQDSPNPDRKSGRNRTADGATPLTFNEADEDGDIDYDDGDRTDWYVIMVHESGTLEVLVDNRIAGGLDIEVYDSDMITLIGDSLTPNSGHETVFFPVEAGRAYYCKVYAEGPGDIGDYIISNFLDTISPTLEAFEATQKIEKNSTVISGTIKDNRGIAAVLLDDKNILGATTIINPESGEIRSLYYPLSDVPIGDTTLHLVAEDLAGNRSAPQEIRISRTDPPPEIQITNMSNSDNVIRTKDTSFLIRGEITDNKRIARLVINGEEFTDIRNEQPLSDVQFLAQNMVRFTYMLENLEYGLHTFEVVAEDNAGQKTAKTLTIRRDDRPQLTIVSPKDEMKTTESRIEIRGTVTDDVAVTHLVINGENLFALAPDSPHTLKKVDTDSGSPVQWEFTYTIEELKYKQNVIQFEIRDDFGHRNQIKRTLVREELCPELIVSKPVGGEEITDDNLIIEGSVFDADGVKELTLQVSRIENDKQAEENSIPIAFDKSGRFTHTKEELPQGMYNIVVKATDSRDNPQKQSFTVTKLDKAKPKIEIITPVDGMEVVGNMVEVEFWVQDNDQIASITLNGQGKWQTSAPGEALKIRHVIDDLQVGAGQEAHSNTIVITAIDINGNENSEQVIVKSRNSDYHSGPDGDSAGAIELPLNERYDGGNVDYAKGDQTDWYTVHVPKYGEVRIILDNGGRGDLNIQVYGSNQDTGRPTETPLKEALTPGFDDEYVHLGKVQGEEFLFIKVFAQKYGDADDYSLETLFHEIDNTPPEIFIEAEEVTFDASIRIRGTVQDDKKILAVSINGKELVLPVNQAKEAADVRAFEHEVELVKGDNPIEVQAEDASGNTATKSVMVTRKNPLPKITISSPKEGQRFKEGKPVIVKGMIQEDETIEKITINGKEITDTFGVSTDPQTGYKRKDFEHQQFLELPGKNDIIVTVRDNDGDIVTETVTVYQDTPPAIIIETPEDSFHTINTTVEIRGVVVDDWTDSQITLNGILLSDVQMLPSTKDQEVRQGFRLTVTLTYGPNTINIDAIDSEGNRTPVTLTVHRDDVAPQVTIHAPNEVSEDTLVIQGQAVDDDGIAAVTIDGDTVNVDEAGNFQYTVTGLAYEERVISIVVKDTRENQTVETFSITRTDDEEPKITVISPEKGIKTREDKLPLKIKVSDNHKLDTIQIINRAASEEIEPSGAETTFTYLAEGLEDGSNEITIVATDTSGNDAKHTFRIHKVPPPRILVTGATSEGLETVEESLNVTGTVQSEAELASVNINGKNISFEKPAGNSFSYFITPLQIGENRLKIIATDRLGGSDSQDLVITRRDYIGPEIEIKNFADGDKTLKEEIVIEVNVSDNDRIAEIIIDEEIYEGTDAPGQERILYYPKKLQDGNNLIKVGARDKSGNFSSRSLQILKINPPEIEVVQPEPTVSETINITGHVRTEAVLASLKIGRDDVQFDPPDVSAGTSIYNFSHQIRLPRIGENTVHIMASDSLGGRTPKQISLTRQDSNHDSGLDQDFSGAGNLPIDGTINDLTVSYNEGDQTDWLKVTLDTTGDLTLTVANAQTGTLDVELYQSDGTTQLQTAQIAGQSTETLATEIWKAEECGEYYVKIMAHGPGDSGQYTITNEFTEIDRIPPKITIDTPEGQDLWIENGSLEISGEASDNAEIENVQCQSENKQIITDGNLTIDGKTLKFDYTVSGLQPEENVLHLVAIDGANYKTTYPLRIFVEDSSVALFQVSSIRPPAKVLVKNEQGNARKVETSAETLTIEGTLALKTEEMHTIKVYVESTHKKSRGLKYDKPLTKTTKDDFLLDVPLDYGENTLKIEVFDEKNNNSATLFLVALRTEEEEQEEETEQSPDIIDPTDSFEAYLARREGNVYAVIIGIGRYKDNDLNLRFTVNDAEEFYKVLIDENYGRVPEKNIKLLINDQATTSNIKSAIGTWLSDNAQEEDTVIIYYAGHGDSEKGDKYWVTYDAQRTDLYGTALNNNEIHNMINRIKSNRLVTFLDACYSADTVKPQKNGTRNIHDLSFGPFAGEGRATISASNGKQLSLELDEYEHGVFTYYLLKGLKGKADQNGDAYIELEEIWNYVKDQVREKAEKAGNPQTPTFHCDGCTSGILLTFDVPAFKRIIADQRYDKLANLYREGDISADELSKAHALLESNQSGHIFNDFFSGRISLDFFRLTLATAGPSE